jgi:hypothetical protein
MPLNAGDNLTDGPTLEHLCLRVDGAEDELVEARLGDDIGASIREANLILNQLGAENIVFLVFVQEPHRIGRSSSAQNRAYISSNKPRVILKGHYPNPVVSELELREGVGPDC